MTRRAVQPEPLTQAIAFLFRLGLDRSAIMRYLRIGRSQVNDGIARMGGAVFLRSLGRPL